MSTRKLILLAIALKLATCGSAYAEPKHAINCHTFLTKYAQLAQDDPLLPKLFSQNIKFKHNKYFEKDFEPEEFVATNNADVNISCRKDDSMNNLNIVFVEKTSKEESYHLFFAVLKAASPKEDTQGFLQKLIDSAMNSNDKRASDDLWKGTSVYFYAMDPSMMGLDIDASMRF